MVNRFDKPVKLVRSGGLVPLKKNRLNQINLILFFFQKRKKEKKERKRKKEN